MRTRSCACVRTLIRKVLGGTVNEMADGGAEPVKGQKWLPKEVESLLKRLHLAGAGRRVMTSTHMETLSVFEEVVAAMHKEGCHRSAGQARSKFKQEKANFFSVMQRHDGHPPPGERPPRFNLLKRLWIQGGRPHWAYRMAASSASKQRTERVQKASEDVEILSSEEEEDDEKEENDDVVELVEEDVAEESGEEQPSTSKASSSEKAQSPALTPQEKEVQRRPLEHGSTGTEVVCHQEKRPEWLDSLEERFSKMESRIDALEQATNAMVEHGHSTRRDVDQLQAMQTMHTKAIVTLRQMVNFNRLRTGVRAPKGEEPVLPFIDDDDVQ